MTKPSRRKQSTDQQLRRALDLHAAGDFKQMVTICRPLTEAGQPPALAHHLLGVALFKLGQNDEALENLRAAVAVEPGNVGFRDVLGQVLADLELIHEARATFEEALKLDPDNSGVMFQLGALFRRYGQPALAMRFFQAVLKREPNNVEALVNVGEVFFALDQFDQALASYDLALTHDDASVLAHGCRAFLLECTGRRDDAIAAYRRVLALDADNVHAHWRLAGLVPTHVGDERLQYLENLARGDSLRTAEGVQLHVTLGKMYEDCSRTEAAFKHYAAANRLRAEIRGSDFDLEAFRDEVTTLIGDFTADFFATCKGRPDAAAEPVFVVGMPRSGTTLVESIIDAHSQAAGTGELPHLRAIRDQLLHAGADNPAATMSATDPEMFARAASQYLQILRAKGAGAVRIVDKMPHNFQFLYLVPLMFSGARIIHCQRDARDTCLSCFVTDFAQGHGYRNDLVTLGRYYNLYRELMEHWHAVLPSPILRVQYEELVADPEAGARRLLDFLDLPWEPGCLEFPQAQRMVRTASTSQVRRGIYRSSAGRWLRFAEQLQPLIDILDDPS